MGSQNLERFLNLLRTDKGVKQQLDRANDTNTFAHLAVKIGAEKGLSFSIEDVKNAIREAIGGSRELSDAELDAVAAGCDNLSLGSHAGGCDE